MRSRFCRRGFPARQSRSHKHYGRSVIFSKDSIFNFWFRPKWRGSIQEVQVKGLGSVEGVKISDKKVLTCDSIVVGGAIASPFAGLCGEYLTPFIQRITDSFGEGFLSYLLQDWRLGYYCLPLVFYSTARRH